MSSSGVIYAIIVGAWAVYLVPMWLRREDELNLARETQRYAAAIKVLAHKEAFERRWAQSGEGEEARPLAAGQGAVSASRTDAVKRATGKALESGAKPSRSAKSSAVPAVAAETRPSTRTSTASTGNGNGATSKRSVPLHTSTARGPITARVGRESGPKSARTAKQTEMALRSRTGLMARRRRVVAILFAVSSLGALVSADLGARYLWAMAIPAVLLSAYIARLRRDERIRVAAHAAKRAAAQKAREAELARTAAEQRAAAAEAEAAREDAQAEAEHRRRAEAARRRSSAAARSRAQAFTQEPPDQLRQASNG